MVWAKNELGRMSGQLIKVTRLGSLASTASRVQSENDEDIRRLYWILLLCCVFFGSLCSLCSLALKCMFFRLTM